ncbi:nitroreductase [Aliiroseovarius sediminis]|uniref:nitroreductase family protein n=1 Tax=Aliiroseovarius sediminis TaxID=2925839 RepID=UPI001F5868D6|nr:nitroreductase [Aliiroseovarius sediminis]MCI2395412.1 nitroreductase [Aliiroseovarius sediminis]
MPDRNEAALQFLLTRRSRPAKTLTDPAPDRAALQPILTAAARSPDHGKLEPWRFIVLERGALARLADLVETRGAERNEAPAQIAKAKSAYQDSPLAVVVVSAPVQSDKIPKIEQVYSAGAVCLALLNAALASGWGANWLTGWPVYDRTFLRDGLGLGDDETVAGVIHIGTQTNPPPERPRPDLDAITTWVDA